MQGKTQRSAGRHRKNTTSQTAKGRVTLFTIAAGAVSTAGVSGAAAAQLQGYDAAEPQVNLAAATNPLEHQDPDATPQDTVDTPSATAAAQSATNSAPQILNMAETKPISNVNDQLSQALQAADARAAQDRANRAPSIALPAEGALTSPFGPRWGSFHYGIDIANTLGTPIFSVMDGTVIDSGPASGYGQWIRIKHDDGSVSVYGHMQTLDVSVGEHVTAGQKIAGMGSLGFSTGSHLHFEIHPDGTTPVDPAAWLAQHGINL